MNCTWYTNKKLSALAHRNGGGGWAGLKKGDKHFKEAGFIHQIFIKILDMMFLAINH